MWGNLLAKAGRAAAGAGGFSAASELFKKGVEKTSDYLKKRREEKKNDSRK